MVKKIAVALAAVAMAMGVEAAEELGCWPDGSKIGEWFAKTTPVDPDKLGKRYVVTDYGVVKGDSTLLQTEAIQKVIDLAAAEGGGVITIPEGVYLSGSLFFKPGTHLKMRSDTPQSYRNILVENLRGHVVNGISILPWTQFHNPVKRYDMPESKVEDLTVRNVDVTTDNEFFLRQEAPHYSTSNLHLTDIKANGIPFELIEK